MRGLPFGAVWTVARERLRRRRVASIGLLVLAGLAAAVPMAVWSASRRTSTAYEQFLAAADPADTSLIVCPEGLDLDRGPGDCFEHRATSELTAVQADPHVRDAARFEFHSLDVGTGPASADVTFVGAGAVSLETPTRRKTVFGEPIIVSGRLAEPGAADELMLHEAAAGRLGLDSGDRVWVRMSRTRDRLRPVWITGVLRTPDNLVPLPATNLGPAFFAGSDFLAPRWSQLAPEFGGVAVWLDDGDGDGLADRLGRQLDQLVVSSPLLSADDTATIMQATDFESRAGTVVAAAAALVGTFFVGQALSRQARSEAADTPTLGAIGFARRDLIRVSAIRWAPVALGAAVVAVLAAVGLSALGPLGVARRGAWDHDVHVDGLVLVTGVIGVVIAVLMFGSLSAAGPRRRRGHRATVASQTLGPSRPSVRTGLGLAWQGFRQGATLPLLSAVLASAVAVGTVIATAGTTSTLREVTDHPTRFGAPWDAYVDLGPNGADPALLADVDGVSHAAILGGTEVSIGGRRIWTQAHFPIRNVPVSRPVIVRGRAPSAPDEVVLGTRTVNRAGVGLGDRIRLRPTGRETPVPFTVVGVGMVTDGVEPNVGQGALVTPAGMNRIEAQTTDDAPLAIGLDDRADRAQTIASLRRRFPTLIAPFPVPPALGNAERLSELPRLLALGAAALAAATFAHALVVSVRRNGRELAVCRVLGFTRGQVRAAVSTQATVLAVAAAVIGVPLGIIGARWGWRTLARAFGLVAELHVPLSVVVTCVLAVLVVANLAAGPAAWSVTRRRTAERLRSE